jgi:hypothetical protein
MFLYMISDIIFTKRDAVVRSAAKRSNDLTSWVRIPLLDMGAGPSDETV